MPDYVMLFNFTQKGVETIKDSESRIESCKKLLAASGAKAKMVYALLGRYDTLWIVEAPNDETIAKLSLQISAAGNVHAETLRAFTEEQYKSIVKDLK